MKILIVIPNLCIGGTNRTLYNMLNLLNKDNFDVSILPMCYSGEVKNSFREYKLLPENVLLSSINLNFKCLFDSGIRMSVKRLLHKVRKKIFYRNNLNAIYRKAAEKYSGKYDLVIGFQEGYATHFVSYIEAPRRIAWVHCDYSNYQRLIGNKDESTVYEKYDKIICVSHYTASVFKQAYPSMSERVVGIHNIMDDSALFKNSKEEITDKRFKTEHVTFISIGRVSDVKRFSFIPEIAAKMLKNGCQFFWYIIGTVGDDSVRLSSEIEKYGVGDTVVFLGPKENPYPYIASSDVLVCPSYSEACPNVVNEAKILHIPVVAADFPTAVEFINDEENGLIVSIRDMAEKLTEVCLNVDRLNHLTVGISDFSYDNSSILREIEQIFAE